MKTLTIVLLLFALCGCGGDDGIAPSPAVPDFQPGAMVRAKSDRPVWAADSRASMGKWVDAENAQDKMGIGQLLAASKVVELPAGTKCLYLGFAAVGLCRLRPQEGPYVGIELWVKTNYIEPVTP